MALKKKTRNILAFMIVTIFLAITVYFVGNFSVLSGQASSFIFDSMSMCNAQKGCNQNGIVTDGDGTGYATGGENRIIGHVETIPKCGQYMLSISNLDGGGKNCNDGSSYVDISINGVWVASAYYKQYITTSGNSARANHIETFLTPETRTGSISNVDITNIVGGVNPVRIDVIAQADWSSGYACGTGFDGLTITASECIGDRLFTRSCPLWTGYSVVGKEFKPGDNVSLKDFPDDAYFCSSTAALVKDSNNRVVANDATPYITINQGGVFTIPEGKTYIMIFMTAKTGDVQALNVLINNLQGSLDEKTRIVADLQLDIDTQASLINSLAKTSAEQVSMIQELQTSINGQSMLIEKLQLTQAEQIRIIEGLNLKISDQALMIERLSKNLEEKIAFVNSLQVENVKQAELIAEMRESFANQAAIIDGLGKTVEDDAVIIKNLGLNLEEQGQLIGELKRTNQEKADLIQTLTTNLAEQQRIIDGLQASVSEKQLIIDDLNQSLKAEQEKVSALTAQVIFDRQALTDYFTNLTFWYKLAIAGLIIFVILLLVLLLKKKRR